MRLVEYNSGLSADNSDSSPDLYANNAFGRPSADFVVARHKDGSVASIYADDIWDFSAYRTSEMRNGRLHFDSVPAGQREDFKWLIFCLDRFVKNGRSGKYTPGTLVGISHVFQKVSQYCDKHNISLVDWFSTPLHMAECVRSLADSYAGNVGSAIKAFRSITNKTGIKVRVTTDVLELIASKYRACKANRSQTALIPSRILFAFISYTSNVIAEFSRHMSYFELIMSSTYNLPVDLERKTEGGESISRFIGFVRRKIADNNNAESFMEYLLSKDITSFHAFKAYIHHIQHCCKELIHAYSGMRRSEVQSLNYDSLKKVDVDDRRVLRLLGNTTKFVGKKKPVQWVTSKEVEPAVECLQFFCGVAYSALTLKKHSSVNNMPLDEMPLFFSYARSLEYIDRNNLVQAKYPSTKTYLATIPEAVRDNLRITEDDYKELKTFDMLRDWEEDGFGVGKVWPIASHQYRRSLAVYSAQSGLISLGALKIQFKHLTEEMAYYYRNNALEAKKLFSVDQKEHMAAEFEKLKSEADFLAYVHGIEMSTEVLKGSQGRHHEKHKATTSDMLIKVYENKGETIRQFKKGERAFKETPVGFCEGTGSCNKKLTGAITSCFSCDWATLKQSKIQRTIKLQEHFVESLDADLPEYRAEMHELNIMQQMEKEWVA